MNTKVMTVIGARPQFIKASPMSAAMKIVGIEEVIVHTGQHFDANMSDIFFDELGIPAPTHRLDINSLSHGAMTGRMLEHIEGLAMQERPDWLLVYGDTNSTLAGALCAAKLGIKIAHVESGLRSYNQAMPEEINRVLTDHISEALFCPTLQAVANLKMEGITRNVHMVGDVMYDATIAATKRAELRSAILDQLNLVPRTYAVCTIHRAENTDNEERFLKVIEFLENAAKEQPIIMAVHPRTAKLLGQKGIKPKGITIVAPLGYLDMCWLLHNARHAYTDSGGLQKEAYFHGVPCTTLRDETEWVETVEAGWNQLWTDSGARPKKRKISDYGDGHSSEKIADILVC